METPEKKIRLACNGCKAHEMVDGKALCNLDYKQLNATPLEACEHPVTNGEFLRLSMGKMLK